MTRRASAVAAWLAIAAMNALWLWAIVAGGFLDVMFAKLAAEQLRLLTPEMIAVTYAAMTGILVVTTAYATVGLLLAVRPGGGRMGRSCSSVARCSPRCHSATRSPARWRSGTPSTRSRTCSCCWAPRWSRWDTP